MKRKELGFKFKKEANPLKPLDPKDPPPDGWQKVDHATEYNKDRFGWRVELSNTYLQCVAWEERELARYRQHEE